MNPFSLPTQLVHVTRLRYFKDIYTGNHGLPLPRSEGEGGDQRLKPKQDVKLKIINYSDMAARNCRALLVFKHLCNEGAGLHNFCSAPSTTLTTILYLKLKYIYMKCRKSNRSGINIQHFQKSIHLREPWELATQWKTTFFLKFMWK